MILETQDFKNWFFSVADSSGSFKASVSYTHLIPLRVHRMKKKLEKMQLKERLIYGYGRVILRMIVSGVLSLIVIGFYLLLITVVS